MPRTLQNLRRRLGWQRRRLKLAAVTRLNAGVLAVRIDAPQIGLFAQLQWAVSIMSYCDRNNLTPLLRMVSRNYADASRGGDWLGCFFGPPPLAPRQARLLRSNRIRWIDITHIGELPLTSWVVDQRFERVRALLDRYAPLRPEVISAVDAFVAEHFAGRRVLGVHFRGTDKWKEAGRVTTDTMAAAIDDALERYACDRLFVATDEQAFLDWAEDRFEAVGVRRLDLAERSTGGAAIHLGGGDAHRAALGAVLDCLLLSRCQALVKTPSILSAYAKVFNPKLPTRMVGEPLPHVNWWPESAIPRWSGATDPSPCEVAA